MHKVFISEIEWKNKQIENEQYHHIINVLRMKIGDIFIIVYAKRYFEVKIQKIENQTFTYEIINEIKHDAELPILIDLYQGYPKGDKLELIIQKAVELGVNQVTPVLMERSIVQLDIEKRKIKQERLAKIMLSASMQSSRNIIPTIGEIKKINEYNFEVYDLKIVAYEEEKEITFKNILSKNQNFHKMAIVIGPEGGISHQEIQYLKQQGFIPVSLGNRILRTETASLYMLSIISYLWGN